MPQSNKKGVLLMKKESWELTYKQFCEQWLKDCKYKTSYEANKNLWLGKQEDLKPIWIQELMKRAEVGSLSPQVIMSFIRLYGEKDLFRTFRGRWEKGVQDFRIPKKLRKGDVLHATST
jgi:hypothetical protein